MPRPPRLQIPGGIYHVGTRGVRRHAIFLDTSDRRYFLSLLSQVACRYAWRCHVFCQMTNHYHLVVETPNADLSAGMARLNGEFAQWSNYRHGHTGHVFERRFYSELLEGDDHLVELARYIVLNPVRAGICDHPDEWTWSSYRAYLGRARPPSFLTTTTVLDLFARDVERSRTAYETFVASALPPRPHTTAA